MIWTVVIVSSVGCFALKLAGHVVPERWLAHPRLQRINALIPISLLSALVVVQGFVTKTHVVIDHRAAGLAVAMAALFAKLPFPVVVVSASITSADLYHLH